MVAVVSQYFAQDTMRPGDVGFEANGLLEVVDGRGMVLQSPEGETEMVLGKVIVRFQSDSLPVRGGCLGEAKGLEVHVAESDVIGHDPRGEPNRGLEFVNRRVVKHE